MNLRRLIPPLPRLRTPPAEKRLLPEGRVMAPMPWVIAIMMGLMVLAAAAGLGLGSAARSLGSQLADRLTIQIVEANPDQREAQAKAVLAALARMPGIVRVERIGDDRMKALLAPWLGEAADDEDLPLPAMIDVTLAPIGRAQSEAISAELVRVAPAARVDDHARSLAPLSGLIVALRSLSFALVFLMATATAAAVMLVARAALNTHRSTIDVMHLLGATDIQIARIFQRRIALDALFGGLLGLAGAILIILAIGRRVTALGSELLGAITLSPQGWALLFLLPLAGTLLAWIAARWTVLSALRKIL